MMRLIHLLAITLLIGSAAYAYSIKYETLYYAETLAKLKGKIQKEREVIAVAKAEWALLTRPDRLQRMVDRHLDLQPMTISQLGRISDIPSKQKGDAIAAKLDALGLDPVSTGSTNPAPPKKPAPKQDGIGAKLSTLGLASPGTPKRTIQVAPPQKQAAAKPATPKPPVSAAPKPAPQPQPKPAAR